MGQEAHITHMADEKRPLQQFTGEIPEKELSQLRTPSKAQMQSILLAADQSASERQASNARIERSTNRAMDFVQMQKKEVPTSPPRATERSKETPELANNARQRDNLRDVAKGKGQEQQQIKEKTHER